MADHDRTDGILNALSGLGGARDRHSYNRPSKPLYFQDNTIDDVYEGSRFASVIIDRLPEDCTRAPFEVTTKTDYGPLFQEDLERLNTRAKFQQAHKWARLMGGAGILMIVDDGLPMDEPMDTSRITDVTALHVFDRSELVVREWYRDLRHPQYGQHQLYSLTPALGLGPSYVHASRVLPFFGRRVRRERQDRYDYWGQSEIERIWQAISDLETATGALATTMHNASFLKLKVKNLAALLTGPDGNDPTTSRLIQRLEAMTLTKSIINALLMDADMEDIENVVSNVTGMIEGYGVFQQNLAFIAEMPLSLLFGNHPKGFSNADESGVANYRKNIASTQQRDYQPNLVRLLDTLAASKLGPSEGQRVPDLGVRFAPVQELGPVERADINSKMVDSAIKLIDKRVIKPEDERARLAQADLATDWNLEDNDEDAKRQALLEQMRDRRERAREIAFDDPEGAEFLTPGASAPVPALVAPYREVIEAKVLVEAPELYAQASQMLAEIEAGLARLDELDRSKTYQIPKGATEDAKKVREWMKTKPNFQGGTATGKARAHQLAQGGEITLDDLIEINAWFARHKGNREIDEEFAAEPWRDAGYTSHLMWGGDTMQSFANRIVEAAYAREDGHTGAMIALMPPPDLSAQVAAYGQPDGDAPHMTLIYMPDYQPSHYEAVCQILRAVTQAHHPLDLTINGAQVLVTPQAWVHALTPTGLGLVSLRARLCEVLAECGLLGAQRYDFVPHMTLAYHEVGVMPPDYAKSLAQDWPAWSCQEVCLVTGDEVIGRFALGQRDDLYGGPDDPKLPDHVRSRDRASRALWVEVFNRTMRVHPEDEGRAIATANAVLEQHQGPKQ
jgi:phage-related protein (TIGR01555 family)